MTPIIGATHVFVVPIKLRGSAPHDPSVKSKYAVVQAVIADEKAELLRITYH